MSLKLNVSIGKLKLKNPVMAASGTFGIEYDGLTDMRGLGAYIAKTITLRPRTGNPPPRVTETPSGMLNSIGLENKGVEDFVKGKLPKLKKLKVPVIVSIAGDDEDEFKELAKWLDRQGGVSAMELNLSCPNIKYGPGKALLAQDKKATWAVVNKVRKNTRLPVIAKLSPNVTDITEIARSAEDAGADAVSLINTLIGMAVDIKARRPVLGNITGGLSGPAIKPIALSMVWKTYNSIKVPVIGIGGIMDHKDAIEFILCGSTAIQVGTANFVDPVATGLMVKGISEYLSKAGIDDINELVGRLSV